MAISTANVQLTGKLLDNLGNPVPGEIAVFSYKLSTDANYSPAGSATTDSNGLAHPPVLTLQFNTLYDFLGTFEGTPFFAASQQMITFDQTQTQEATTVSVVAKFALIGTTYTINVTGDLTSSVGPVPGEVLTVLLNGVQVGVTDPTDAQGGFAFAIANILPGTDTVSVQFAGTTTFLQSSGTTTISTNPSSGIGLGQVAAIGGLLAAVTVGLFVTRRRGSSRRRRR